MAQREHLVREILKELGVYQAGQDLPPEDYRVVDERLPFEVATLGTEGIYQLDDLASIPDDALLPLAKYLSGTLVGIFGLGGDERQTVLEQQVAAEGTLRRLQRADATYARMRPEFF